MERATLIFLLILSGCDSPDVRNFKKQNFKNQDVSVTSYNNNYQEAVSHYNPYAFPHERHRSLENKLNDAFDRVNIGRFDPSKNAGHKFSF